MGPTLEEFLYGSGSGCYFTQASGMSPYECSIAGRKGDKSSQTLPTMKISVFCWNLETALVRDRNLREGGPDRGPERSQPISRKTQHTLICTHISFSTPIKEVRYSILFIFTKL